MSLGLAFGLGIIVCEPVSSEQRQPNWPSSEYHGKLDGNGRPIPCRCLFKGQSLPLGATVCMNTHKGTVLTQCDLQQNNTSWVPTDEPCAISQLPGTAEIFSAVITP